MSAELKCYTEERNSPAFVDFRMRGSQIVNNLITGCPYRAIAFKPLTESHQARELLSLADHSKGIWVYRRASDRANSAVRKFGSHNLELMTAFSRGEQLNRWQAQGISPASFEFIRSLDYQGMNRETAAAVFWFVRNQIVFEQNLHENSQMLLLAYEQFVQHPAEIIRVLCDYVGIMFKPVMVAHIHSRSIGKRPSRVSEEIDGKCAEFYETLERARKAQWQRLGYE